MVVEQLRRSLNHGKITAKEILGLLQEVKEESYSIKLRPQQGRRRPNVDESGDLLEGQNNFGRLLRRARLEHGFTQLEVGEIVGRSRGTIAKYELGANVPEDVRVQLLRLLHIG